MNAIEIVLSIGALALPVIIAAIGGALTAFLKSPHVEAFIKAQSDKLAAEASMYVSNAMSNNHNTLGYLVRGAMAYAEQHEVEILAKYKSKADYVIAKVSSDPRFAGLGQPASAIEGIVEDLFETFYKDYGKEHDHTQ